MKERGKEGRKAKGTRVMFNVQSAGFRTFIQFLTHLIINTGAFKKINAKAVESGPKVKGPLSTLFEKRQIRLSEVWINAVPL